MVEQELSGDYDEFGEQPVALRRVIVAGATGWVGQALIPAIIADPELTLVGAVARRAAGQDIGIVLGGSPIQVRVSATLEEALATRHADVLIDYTTPATVMEHVRLALRHEMDVVIGTTGLSEEDLDEIEHLALAANLGVVVASNFSLTAVLMQQCAVLVRRYIPTCEIIEYHHADKPDAPSGTARETAELLAGVEGAPPTPAVLPPQFGPVEARGALIHGIPVHSVRLPGLISHQEVLFSLPGELLTVRHDAYSATPYVAGTLLAAKHVAEVYGLVRGLGSLLFGQPDEPDDAVDQEA